MTLMALNSIEDGNGVPSENLSAHKVEQRRFQRVKVNLLVRFLTPDRKEHSGRSINMSPASIAIATNIVPEIGTTIIAYVEQIGRLEGHVVRLIPNGFVFSFAVPDSKRERLAETLTWVANATELGLVSDRRHERFAPSITRSVLNLSDGSYLMCSIIDVSVSGAKVSPLAKPNIGEKVTLGQIKARVVRHMSDGIGLEFDTLQRLADLNSKLRPQPPQHPL